MEDEQVTPKSGEAVEISQGLIEELAEFLISLLRPWNAYQIGIVLAVMALAIGLARWLGPKYYDWLHDRQGWPMARMRWAVVIHKRLPLILFVLLIWIVVPIMREVTWPSRSYLIGIVGNLALAWLVVALATRLIANRVLRQVVRLGAWVWVTLRILNLTEEFQRLMESLALDLGDIRISVWTVLQATFILGVMFVAARFVSRTTSERIEKNEDFSPSMRVLTVKVMQIVLYTAAFFIGLKAVGVDLTGLAFLSGAIGLGLGFGLQKVVSNLVSGVIILLDKSIKPGDVISLGDTFGWINSLGARYVSVVTRDGKEYLIPNEDLITGQVVNWSHTDDFVRLDIHFGTSYHDDPHKVRALAIEAAKSVDRTLTTKAPVCHIVGFGDSSVDYVLRFWIKDPTGGLTNIRGNVFLALWDIFHENGISIPFPQREVRLLGDTSTAK
ncbi:MAG: mechanosensitive ion channel [Paracoccaceae bacterium]|jgi:small-conductance mechanosensitive channel|nr:mechanosensitive ion channel [Paracoccaceae bacterium]